MYIDDKIVWNVATVRLADLLRDLDGVIQERGAKSPDNRERLDRDHRPH
jgi:hypothetical protein